LAFEAGCDDYCEREVDEMEWQGGRLYLDLGARRTPAPTLEGLAAALDRDRLMALPSLDPAAAAIGRRPGSTPDRWPLAPGRLQSVHLSTVKSPWTLLKGRGRAADRDRWPLDMVLPGGARASTPAVRSIGPSCQRDHAGRCVLAAEAPAAVGVEGLADEPRQGGEVVAAVVAAAVDEEAGGAGDPAQVGAVDIGGDAGGVGALAEIL
jgi:hypothetical protein